ncbi:MAG: hypothetical protein K9M99_10655 [Candidatus Cloacimonetes bacterium]|nr:hypothetical protein [Candidatus Cloacimonadota bacterium]
MNKLKIIVIIILGWGYMLMGSGLLLPWSANSAASGGSAFICHESGAIFSYPALTGKGIEFSSTLLYNLPELPYYVFAAGTSYRKINLGYALAHLHHPNYKESNQVLNLSYCTGELQFGINLRNLLIQIPAETMASAFTIDLGMAWQYSQINTAISWLNAAASEIDDERLPVYVIWEMSWQIVPAGDLAVRIEKESGFEFHPAIAGEYTISRTLRIISSYSMYPASIGSGFQITLGRFAVSYALQYHEDLLESHYISLQYAPDN